MIGITGRIIRLSDEELMVLVRIHDTWFNATDRNCKLIDQYLQTGDKSYLDINKFEDELELEV